MPAGDGTAVTPASVATVLPLPEKLITDLCLNVRLDYLTKTMDTPSPGPGVYGIDKPSCGKQVKSTQVSFSVVKFGTEPRNRLGAEKVIEAMATRTPGPGSYQNTVSTGPQVTSDNKSSPAYSFGGKDVRRKHDSREAAELPGPGQYNPESAGTPRRIVFGTEAQREGLPRSMSAGCVHGIRSTLGMQAESTKVSPPAYSFGPGLTPRTERATRRQQGGGASSSYPQQGPFSRRPLSTQKNAPSIGFGQSKAKRFPNDDSTIMYRDYRTPGPNSYDPAQIQAGLNGLSTNRNATGSAHFGSSPQRPGKSGLRQQQQQQSLPFNKRRSSSSRRQQQAPGWGGVPGPGSYGVPSTFGPQASSRYVNTLRPSMGSR